MVKNSNQLYSKPYCVKTIKIFKNGENKLYNLEAQDIEVFPKKAQKNSLPKQRGRGRAVWS